MSANGYGIIAVTGRTHCQRQVAFFITWRRPGFFPVRFPLGVSNGIALRDVVQSFGKIRYLVFIQDRGEGGTFGKIKIQDSIFVYNILKSI